MTCIVGYIDNKFGKVYIGGDSAGVTGNDIVARKDVKVFKNGQFIIGCTTSFRMIQILRFKFKPPKLLATRDVYEYMCTDFIDAVRTSFSDSGFMQTAKHGDEQGGQFLVAYKDRLFEIGVDFQVGEHADGYTSLGHGSKYALGAIHSVYDNSAVRPYDRVRMALNAATHFSGAVCEPFTIINT